ncbi:M3 family metallopeptidase [Pontivivens insulae]|uniref:M3 family metallopeptidase n=1 Tax=Pontivivens insulae TaxID=1639689 RepID=UPI000D5579FE|nr:M3 family metallopeptidase [Pontivivens insulae]
MTNPLISDWNTPFQMPPFEQIETGQFAEAFDVAINEARAGAEAVATQAAEPTFENTIEALEQSDALLDRVAGVFYNLSGTDSDSEIETLMRDLSPRLSALSSEIFQDQRLFSRVDALWSKVGELGLDQEQARVLELYHRSFVRAGAALAEADRARLAEIGQALAKLGTQFTQNLLADERDWGMALTADDLAGLPDDLKRAMSVAAGGEGYRLTLSRSIIVPFLENSTRRDLRETAWKAWTARGANGGQTDNRAIAAEILALRHEKATLLGFDDFAHFKLATEMAGTPDRVRDLLMKVWSPAKAQAERDAEQLRGLIAEAGQNHDLEGWDWRFYEEKLRAREHDFDAAALKPYFPLDSMIEASFDVARKLFNLDFRPLNVPLYHEDARAWEVVRGDTHIGVFIGDYFARPSKRSGAWCSRFRGQQKLAGDIRPIVINVCNFAKGDPSLLTFDDARTLFHEFGHALHSLLSDVTYPLISGTSVARDFVELPSQLYEHWLSERPVLESFARHHETGEPLPGDLLDKLLAAETFGQGFATVEYVASALVDLDFHTGKPPADAMDAQAATLARIGQPSAIPMRHATPNFAHVFAGDGYSAGYYSYMWSEVMDADAFEAFKETGNAFDPAMAEKLAAHIYSAGGSRPPEDLYTAFRGQMPGPEALLKGRGFADA